MMSGRTLRARAILDYNVDRALNKQAEDCKKGSVMQGNTVQQGARRSGRTAGKENGVSYR